MGLKKALIHIGGSHLQISSICWAKELGLHVVVTDQNPSAPGREIANQFEMISGTDIPAMLRLAYRVNDEFQLIGAYSSNDFGLQAVALIAEMFRLPGCSSEAVKRALDKSVSKSIWQRNKLPIPKGYIIQKYTELLSTVDELGLPVILKPTCSCGSQGVQSVWNINELKDAYNSAKRISPFILVEQIVAGHHIDVNGLFIEGEFLRCGTMDRYFSEPPHHYPIWGCQPSSLTKSQEDDVYVLVEQAARLLGIKNGPVKADVIWANSGPFILELAPRFHGDVSTAHVTPLATGNNPIKSWLAYMMDGGKPLKYLSRKADQFAGWRALFPSCFGKLEYISGIDDAKIIKGVQDVFISAKPGVIIKPHRDNSTVCGFVWAVADNKNELFKIMKEASLTVRFFTEGSTDNDFTSHDLQPH